MRVHPAAALGASVLALLAGAGSEAIRDRAPHAPPAGPPRGAGEPRFARTFAASRFVRGNLHSHTTRSDGDASPLEVARWYHDRGYGFVALTDHNVLSNATDVPWLASPGATDFVILPGEEVTMWVKGLQVHVNALCTRTLIDGGTFDTASAALEHAIGEIRAQDGVALVNHPNFDWALTPADVVFAEGAGLLEIASGHPYVHAHGDAAHPSHEQMWDDALTAGRDVMGVGVDDAHHLVTDADPEAFPGAAWVEVFADEPRVDALCDALRHGSLYASTGAELRSLAVRDATYELTPVDADARVVFVGRGGRVLAQVATAGGEASYRLVGDEGYVRARIEAASGTAWAPAVRVVHERPGGP